MQAPTGELHLKICIIKRFLIRLSHATYYREYASVLNTKELLYYRRHSILTVEHHASFGWWATSLNTHHECFLVWNFVHISGKRLCCVTSLGISLGRSFHICVRAFRQTACVICLTRLSHYATFGLQKWEEACMRYHKKANVSLLLEQLC